MKRGRTSFFSSNILSKVEYPDATTGVPSTAASDDTSYTYDVQGEPLTYTDQNGTTHTYTYDVLGRETLDSVAVAEDNPENVDTSVLAQGYSFDTGGRLYQATSYANANGTDPVNQVQYAYNGLGQETSEWQEHAGAVDTGSSAQVQYAYSSIDDGSRLTDMIYPNGRQEDYLYDGADGIDSAISRVTSIADDYDYTGGEDPAPVETYTYLGLNTIVQRADGDGQSLSYIQQSGDTLASGDGGDRYTGLDRFGRIIDQNWTDGSTSTERFQYGYDQDGNVLYKNNIVAPTFSELYHANSSSTGDDNSAYDPLNRLTGFRRGTLSASVHNDSTPDTVSTLNTVASDDSTSYSLDALGNQAAVNDKNQLTGGDTTYDHNGNMTEDADGNTFKYDAWNRQIYTSQSASDFGYDALGRRITYAYPGEDYYYAADGHIIEQGNDCGPAVDTQYVWSLAGPNDLILRDSDGTSNTDDENLGTATNGLTQRVYVEQDANENVTALIGPTGTTLEHFVYAPYGAVQVINAAYTATTTDSSGMVYLFQGGRLDPNTGEYHFGSPGRDYSVTSGNWLESHAAGYVNGLNTYQGDGSNPIGLIDPSGQSYVSGPVGEPGPSYAPVTLPDHLGPTGGGGAPHYSNPTSLTGSGSGGALFFPDFSGPVLSSINSWDSYNYIELKNLLEHIDFNGKDFPAHGSTMSCTNEIGFWYDTDPSASETSYTRFADPFEILEDMDLKIAQGQVPDYILIGGHGSPGSIDLGDNVRGVGAFATAVDFRSISGYRKGNIAGNGGGQFVAALLRRVAPHGTIEFATCKSGKGPDGDELLKELNALAFDMGRTDVTFKLHNRAVSIGIYGSNELQGYLEDIEDFAEWLGSNI